MNGLLDAVRGAVALDIATLVRFRDREDTFRRGLTVLVTVGLIVGAVTFAVDLVRGFTQPALPREIADLTQLPGLWTQMLPGGVEAQLWSQFQENLEAGVDIARSVASLPTPLPRPAGTVLEALGDWITRPLTLLGGFLGYGIWVMLAAKLLGGRGRLQEFLGTAALSSVPHLLLVLGEIPCVGPVLGLMAWIWSAVIWVAATAVAHGWVAPVTTEEGVVDRYQVEWGRPLLAVALPALVVAGLVLIAAIGVGALFASALRAAIQ